MTYMAMPFHKTPAPGDMIFTIMVDSSLVIITNTIDLFLGVEKRVFKEIPVMHFHYMTYGNNLAQEPCPMVMKFTILVYPFLVLIIIYLLLVCLIFVWG